MDTKLVDEILDELLPVFEAMEAQSAALLMFLKDKELLTNAQIEPYLRDAANASNVRWRARRVRLERLLTAAFPEEPKPDETSSQQNPEEPAPTQEAKPESQQDVQAAARKGDVNKHGKSEGNREDAA